MKKLFFGLTVAATVLSVSAMARDWGRGRDRFEDFRRGRDRGYRVHCKSNGYNYNECYVGGWVEYVRLDRQRSSSPCDRGYSYGITRNGRAIWVDRGCEGDFLVYSR